jgi:1,4-dihydroxy-6-naphthoate synthase
MWVNDMTLEIGDRGREAIQTFLDRGHDAGIIPRRVVVDFVEA